MAAAGPQDLSGRSPLELDSSLVFPLLGEVPESLFPASFVASAALAEDYGRAWALALAGRLGLGASLVRGADAGSLLAEHGFVPGFRFALEWLLASLMAGGWLDEEEGRYRARQPLPEAPLSEAPRERLREELLAADARNAPTLALLDAAAAAYPSVARGERSGEEVLLGPAGMGLWGSYFGNDNPLYAINNRLAALAATNRLAGDGSLRVLEVGAGGGSGAEALLAELSARGELPRLAEYRATEPSPFFRRRSQRSLPAAWPGVAFSFGDLDVDRPWGEQGAAAGGCELVYAVNVLHVAKDLSFTLREAYAALAPGGWLVAGECVRPFAGAAVAAELVFGLLAGFREVETDAELRPRPGFLTPEQWARILAHAGFSEVTIVPDLSRIREVTRNFLSGAVCGRRPSP